MPGPWGWPGGLIDLDRRVDIRGSTYAELDSGHVVRAEKPEEFIRLVRGFLQPATKFSLG
jgi:hypothetical protein